jgi:cysteine sulfinate desulfinase/cysteine desulfurase-like protein
MAVPHELAISALRFSFGRETTEAQLDEALAIIAEALQVARRVSASGAPA